MNHIELGKKGEALALGYLLEQDYSLLAKNYRWKHEEIDLIVAQDDAIVFVEVKTRRNTEIQSPLQAVSKAKQRHLIRAANHYITEKECLLDARFDVVSVVLKGEKAIIEHIPNAFYPTL